MKFFWNKTKGLNADIERHRKEEKLIRAEIEELQQELDSGNGDKFIAIRLKTYKEFLNRLLESKAEVVAKLGR